MLSTPLERFGQQVSRIFVDYCGHSSLAGVAHITNRRHHWTERLFWTICILIGWLSALLLIRQYVELFQRTAISVAVENVDIRTENSTFPAVGICEMGYTKQVYPRLEALVESLRVREEMEYSYDVEDFMLRIVFQNLYNNGAFAAYCEREESCEECVPCPYDGYQRFAALVRANCSELFDECRWNGEPFECCQYFRPIQTTVGLCFLLNSIQTVNRYGQHWLRMEVNKAAPKGELLLKLHLAASTYLLNEEDIPHMLLQRLQFDQTAPGTVQKLHVTLQNIVNDPEVRNVDIAVRRCLFPDERINSNYGKYSYAVCVTECLKREQLRVCNCYYHNMLLDQSSDNSSQVCNFDGINCLDKHNLMAPETKVLQPWRTHGLFCRCHPSCTEHDIRVVGKEMYYNDGMERTVMINLITLPTQRYRRQVVRQIIDVVVSFGGILGLFTGASILSLAEFVYFFTVRFAFNWGDNERDNARDGSQSSDIDDDMIVQRQVHF